MTQQGQTDFGSYEEGAFIALFIDYPETFYGVAEHITPENFTRPEAQYILTRLLMEFQSHGQIPSRALLRDQITKHLIVGEFDKDVVELLDTPVNERDVASLRGTIFTWAKNKAYGKLYTPETIRAYEEGKVEVIDKIVEDAHKISNVTVEPLWVLERAEELIQPNAIEKLSTGFKKLDMTLNEGGPSSGEVLCYMAPPNVGKSAVLINSAVNSALLDYNTLLFSLEMTDVKTGIRSLGAITEIPMKNLYERSNEVLTKIKRLRSGLQSRLGIFEFGALEVSTAHIEHTVDYLKRSKNFVPKVIVIDYLELMISRDTYANRDEYLRQKRVATELLTMAKKLDVLVYTASQGNRASTKSETRTMEDMAESFGKNMPLSYVVTLNQTDEEYSMTPPQLRMYIAKNREGPKNVTITCQLDYTMMKLRETFANG
mgnify:CR=1 FL=1